MGANFERTCGFSIMLQPAIDLPGQWVAHCLEMDVMSQGDSLSNAIESIQEAIELSLMDDLEAGVSRAGAPGEFWDEWFSVMDKGQRAEIQDIERTIRHDALRVATLIYARISVTQQTSEHFVPFGPPKLTRMAGQADRSSAPAPC